jgi:hypothetical protein
VLWVGGGYTTTESRHRWSWAGYLLDLVLVIALAVAIPLYQLANKQITPKKFVEE